MTARSGRRPSPAWLPYFIGASIAVMLVPVFWKEIDNDVYYIIAQGREIMAAGDPGIGAPAYFGTMRGPVQNWLWCVLLDMADKIPGNAGFAAIVCLQATLLQLLLHRMLARHTGDGWIAMAFSLLCLLPTGSIYLYGLRPEMPSVMLVLLTILALEEYRRSEKTVWLVLLPLCVLAEMNVHAAMWPYHFAAMLAYLVPVPAWIENDNIEIRRPIIAAIAASAAALFLNPYGTGMIAYVFRSVAIFKYVPVEEQGSMPVDCPQGMMCMMLLVLLLWLASKKQIRSSGFWTAGGLLFLAFANYHSAIFVPVVSYAVSAALLDGFEALDPDRIGTSVPVHMVPCSIAASALCLALSGAAIAFTAPGMHLASYGYMMPAIETVYDLQSSRGGSIVTDGIAGSVMEWYGIERVFTDGRCELMLGSVNGERDAWPEYKWFETGVTEAETISMYGNIQGCLDANGVEYIVLNWAKPKFPFLAGYVSASPDWEKIGLDDPDGKSLYDVWVRSDRQEADEWLPRS